MIIPDPVAVAVEVCGWLYPKNEPIEFDATLYETSIPTIEGKILFAAKTAVFEKFDSETKFVVVPEAVCVDVWTVDVWLPINFSFIDGIPKHVPKTREHPTTPLANGINTVFPKLFCFWFWLKFAFEVLLEITSWNYTK